MVEELLAQQYKNNMYQEFARVGKALASDKRIELLYLLVQSSKTVDELVQESGASVANTSKHLQVLKEARLVSSEKQGTFVRYQIASSEVADLVYQLKRVSQEQLVEVSHQEEELHASKGVTSLALADLADRMAKGAVLIDLRPQKEYETGHIEGALNFPLVDLKMSDLKEFEQSELIFYCRGQVCANADLATAAALEAGYEASSLNETYYDWLKFQQ